MRQRRINWQRVAIALLIVALAVFFWTWLLPNALHLALEAMRRGGV